MEHWQVLLALAIVLQCVDVINAIVPATHPSKRGSKVEVTDSYNKVKNTEYHLDIYSKHHVLWRCSHIIEVYGNGIVDSFHSKCEKSKSDDSSSSTFQKYLLYGTPTEDAICLFSDEPGTLIVIQGKTCTKRTYDTPSKVTYRTEDKLNDEECQELFQVIAALEKDPNNNESRKEGVPINPADDKDDNIEGSGDGSNQ